jgi:RNA recognition motif-containing protein
MSRRLYVGNLPSNTTEDSLSQAFAAWNPSSATLPAQHADRKSAFGFVEIPDDNQAALAIDHLVEGLTGGEERTMASSEKKRAREQKAAARRDRAAQKRLERAADRGGAAASPWPAREEVPEQRGEAPPTEGAA